MRSACVAAALAVSILIPDWALAERRPTTIDKDARVRAVYFNATDVIRVDTHLRVNTAIELGPGERINQVLLGDSESYEVQVLSNRNTLSIKPVVAGAATNMTIYTGRRAIAFSLREGRVQTPSYRVVVRFPQNKTRSTAPKLVSGSRDLGYQLSGEGRQRPVRVWNDGQSTFFEFRRGIRPSIFGVNSSGYEVTLNSTTRGAIVRVAGVRNDYSVRLGEEVICIRRVGGGQRTDSRTVNALRQREF